MRAKIGTLVLWGPSLLLVTFLVVLSLSGPVQANVIEGAGPVPEGTGFSRVKLEGPGPMPVPTPTTAAGGVLSVMKNGRLQVEGPGPMPIPTPKIFNVM